MITPDLQRRFRFFLANAGYATPPGRTQCALDLARAELAIAETDLEFIEQYDEEPAYCFCDDPRCQYHEGSDYSWDTIGIRLVKPCKEHGTDCRHAETVASLWGIMDPDNAYRRVVRAELAGEYLQTIK